MKQNNMKKIIISLVGIFLLIVIFYSLVGSEGETEASVLRGGEYFATTTTDMAVVMNQIVSNRVTTLGSIVIASSSDTAFRIWNATSTRDSASTTLATLEPNASEGTYTFDVVMTRGLILELPTGSDGSIVTTFRPQ